MRNGVEMLAWWKSTFSEHQVKKFHLVEGGKTTTMQGFYDDLSINGASTSVMGCLQSFRFPRAAKPSSDPGGSLDSFVHGDYFRVCRWKHEDGLPGGFGYQALLYKEKATGAYAAFPRSEDFCIDLSLVGKQYEWVLLQVDIFDFVRSFPPLKRFAKTLSRIIKESAYIVVHEDFMRGTFPPAEGVRVERGLGYSFVPALVHSNFFGFGPGRFGTALKLFRFGLTNQEEMQIDLAFVVAPRSQKVLYLRGFDPVYTIINLLDTVTFGKLGLRQRAHDRLDFIMLRQHGQVHQNFIEGLSKALEARHWTDFDAATGGPPSDAEIS